MRVKARGTVFQGEVGSERSSACFHDICVAPGGRWLCAFRVSPRKANAYPQRILLTHSDDEGATWTEPVEPFQRRTVDGKRGDWRAAHLTALGGRRLVAVLYWVDASDESLPFFNEQTEGLLDSRIFLSFSDDGGETWSGPLLVDTAPYNVPTPITGPLLVLANGDWALQFETNKRYYDTSVWRHEAVLLFSSDGGRTWPEHTTVASDPEARIFYWDQRPNVLADGSILAPFWTFDRRTAAYLNMHARRSEDNGRTWSKIWDTGVPGQPAPPVSLPDGRILMPYVDREGPTTIRCRTSADGGRTWPRETELVLGDAGSGRQQGRKATMQDAWAEMSAFSIGLPRTARLAGGDVVVVYYAGPRTDWTGLHWVRLGAAG
jgi:hypothetical protein